jgi:hypothetical protein
MEVQMAAIALQDRQMIIVAVGMDLLDKPWEADLTIDRLTTEFGSAPVVLMAQKDDGTPRYHGERDLVELLADVPVERMPWRTQQVKL